MTEINSSDRINKELVEILSKDSGYFGRVNTWGQRLTKYEYIGYELTDDFLPVLEKLSEKQRVTLIRTMNYFRMHAQPLGGMLRIEKTEGLYNLFAEISWSHFMTVIMFGMLELVVRNEEGSKLNKNGDLMDKGVEIKKFLERNLPSDIKESVVERYTFRISSEKNGKCSDFSSVVDHLWNEIRCGFIHEAGFDSKGLEWSQLSGLGTRENPIKVTSDVPMQELLQLTWLAILNSFGYTGSLVLPKSNR